MPPAKKPILTLFKSARAFGVGMVLATKTRSTSTTRVGQRRHLDDRAPSDRAGQGPVARWLVVAGGTVDIKDVGDVIGGLGRREFMMRGTGREAPMLFTTCWAMSYLRGLLTREQISTLMAGRYQPSQPTEEATPTAGRSDRPHGRRSGDQRRRDRDGAGGATDRRRRAGAVARSRRPVGCTGRRRPQRGKLAPSLATRVSLLYDDDKLDLRETEEWEAVLFLLGATVDPAASIAVDHDDRDLRTEAPSGATYVLTDAPLDRKTFFTESRRPSSTTCTAPARCRSCATPSSSSSCAGETPEEFAARCSAAADEGADRDQVALQAKYEGRIAKAGEALGRRWTGWPRPRPPRPPAASPTWSRAPAACWAPCSGGRGAPARWRATWAGCSRAGAGAMSRPSASLRREPLHDRQEALTKLEADLARTSRRSTKWTAKAAAIEPIEVLLERSDIRATARCVVWIPVG